MLDYSDCWDCRRLARVLGWLRGRFGEHCRSGGMVSREPQRIRAEAWPRCRAVAEWKQETRHTCRVGGGSSNAHGSASKSGMSRVTRVSSGGVGRDANGYSLESRDCRERGSLTKRGGYERLVVVVVVIVFVSTHSATSNCSRAGRRSMLFSSSHLNDTCWLRERSTSVDDWRGAEPGLAVDGGMTPCGP